MCVSPHSCRCIEDVRKGGGGNWIEVKQFGDVGKGEIQIVAFTISGR